MIGSAESTKPMNCAKHKFPIHPIRSKSIHVTEDLKNKGPLSPPMDQTKRAPLHRLLREQGEVTRSSGKDGSITGVCRKESLEIGFSFINKATVAQSGRFKSRRSSGEPKCNSFAQKCKNG